MAPPTQQQTMKKEEKKQWVYLVHHLTSKEVLMYESLGAISRELDIPRATLYYNLSDPDVPVYRHKVHWIERIERG